MPAIRTRRKNRNRRAILSKNLRPQQQVQITTVDRAGAGAGADIDCVFEQAMLARMPSGIVAVKAGVSYPVTAVYYTAPGTNPTTVSFEAPTAPALCEFLRVPVGDTSLVTQDGRPVAPGDYAFA